MCNANPPDEKSVLILGVGNFLLSDEGVGIHVVRRLQSMSLPPHVEAMDGGTCGFELIRYFSGREKVIIIDAAKTDAEPGTVVRFTPDDIALQPRTRFSVHEKGLHELLSGAKRLDHPPEVVFIGIVPEEASRMSTALSPRVDQRFCTIVSILVDELTSAPRPHPPHIQNQ